MASQVKIGVMNWAGRCFAAVLPDFDVCCLRVKPKLPSLLALLAIAIASGCDQGGTSTKAPPNDSVLRGVLAAYSTASRNLNRPPQNLDELKVIVASVAKDPAALFRSTRDNQDFVIVWGLRLDSVPPGTILACERTGVDGIRQAVTTDGNIR